MKSFTDIFIRRPVLATVVSLLILIAGLQAIRSLNLRQYPLSENATVTVTTVYVGASADLVRGFVTQPLERAIAAADGIDYMESASALGLSTITVHLRLNYDSKKALGEISSKVDQVRNDLPPEAEIPTLTIATADSQFASAYLSFSSDILQANQITDYLTRIVQPRLTAIEGVQKADILGGRTFAMRIWLKPDRLAAFNISPTEVRTALTANNFLSAIGHTKGSLVQVNLTANTDLRSVDEFKNLVVRRNGDQLVRLRDVADVVLGAEDYDSEVRFSSERAVFIGVWVLPNANSLDVVKRVRTELASIQKDLPTGLQARVAYDATQYISDALREVVKTLLITLTIVSVVIFLFLGSFRSVLIPLVAIPLSLIGAVFLMQVFGFTLNLLTLLAIVLAVGLVVDDAIVMVENIERHIREGKSPVDAALLGARELVGPVIAMTITLAAVYAPIAFQGGLTGSLFHEFALTLAGAVFISGIVALTLSPVMASGLLSHDREDRGMVGRINRDFDRLKNFYGRVLDWTLARRPMIYTVWIGLSLLSIPMFKMAWQAKEPAPAEDQGVIFGFMETPPDATIEQMSFYADVAGRLFAQVPEKEQVFQLTQPNFGIGGMVLKPWGERKRTAFQILPETQAMADGIPGIALHLGMPSPLPTGSENFPMNVVLSATAEPEEILGFARQLQQECATNGMFAFPPQIDTKVDQPEVELFIDRDKVASLGLDMQTVGSDLSTLVGGDYVNRFDLSGRSYKVIPQMERGARLDAQQLENTYVKGPGSQLIPVSTFAYLTNHTTPRALNRFQQLNSVKISGVAIVPLDTALKFLETDAARILPSGYKLDYTGDSRFLRVEGDKFLPAFALAVVLIILVLAAQFNSFRDPFIIILGSVPLAIFGALIFCFLKMPNPNLTFWTNGWTTSMNIYSEVGLITLVGLISKNGILIVQFANELQRQNRTKIQAIREAAMLRLRPVLMTTVATIAGNFPLTLVTGAGAAARNSIGIVLVAGMSIGTLFTLLVIPSIYILIAKDHSKESRAPIEEYLTDMSDNPSSPNPAPPPKGNAALLAKLNSPLFLWPATIVLAVLLFFGLGYLLDVLTHESTDDAFIAGHVVSIAPRIDGQVSAVHVLDNQMVRSNDLLVEIDPSDYAITVAQKQAAAASQDANVKTVFAVDELMRKKVATAEASERKAQADADASAAGAKLAAMNFERAASLLKDKTVSQQEFDAAQAANQSAQADLNSARQNVDEENSKVDEANTQLAAAEAEVGLAASQWQEAQTNVASAQLNLSYTKLFAPCDGRVTRKQVEAGDYLQTGQSIMSIVPVEVWVVANFKESQLKKMKPGQGAFVTIDALGGRKFRAHVDSVQAGSGAAFSLLPPENATGNFVKVIQRVPVKILFDEPLPADHTIGPGLSVTPSVQTSSFRMPDFVTLIAAIILAVMAAFGFQKFLDRKEEA